MAKEANTMETIQILREEIMKAENQKDDLKRELRRVTLLQEGLIKAQEFLLSENNSKHKFENPVIQGEPGAQGRAHCSGGFTA